MSSSRPVDLYVIATPTVTYHLTSYNMDVTYAGQVYTATTMSRGNQEVAQDLTGRELIVYLPITHPLVQRFAASGIPDRDVLVTLSRLQQVSSIAVQAWSGFGQSMSFDLHVAMLRVPSLTDDAMKIRLPVISAQRLCNHVLYDAQCTVDRESSSSTGTSVITSINDNTITTTNTGSGSQYVFGDILHNASGERRMVIAQAGSILTLNVPFVAASIGDVVRIAPGCDHSVTTCRDKFNNVVNFGGHPQMNAAFNPWLPAGLGIVTQG